MKSRFSLVWRYLAPLAFVALLVFYVVQLQSFVGSQTGNWSYSQLVSAADNGSVKSLYIAAATGTATDTKGHKYTVQLPPDQTVDLANQMKKDGVDVTFAPTSGFGDLLLALLPNLLFIGIMIALLYWGWRSLQRGQNQVLSFGRSRPALAGPQHSSVTFADVAGVQEAKAELEEIVEFLRQPQKFTSLGARIPKGVLMVGPPGSGKTLLAKAVAGEAGVPFFSISGSEFVEMFVGVGASRVRDLFEQAKKASPAIVFVDEIDAVGRQRGAGLGGGHDEREQTLNQLLVEMDGFTTDVHVIVIAATNRPDVLDPALLRPGRFDRHVTLDRPDIAGRRAILNVHAKNKPLDPKADLDTIARQTPGFCGADLANLLNEAAILTARADRKLITQSDMEEAIYRVIAGPERKSRVITDAEKKVIAFHESGHALTSYILPHGDKVHSVSIVSRGMALGWTLTLPEEDRHLADAPALHEQLAGMMGGRAAEEVVFGQVTSGAEDDIRRATALARKMVTQWGMSNKVGPVAMGENDELVFLGRDLGTRRNYSEDMASVIDSEVRRFIEEAFEKSKAIIAERRPRLDALAAALLASETVKDPELDALLSQDPAAPPPPPLPGA